MFFIVIVIYDSFGKVDFRDKFECVWYFLKMLLMDFMRSWVDKYSVVFNFFYCGVIVLCGLIWFKMK